MSAKCSKDSKVAVVQYASTSSGERIIQHDYNESKNDQWILEPASAPVISSVNIQNNSYLFKGGSYEIRATIRNAPSVVNWSFNGLEGVLTYNSSYGAYRGTLTVPKFAYVDSNGVYHTPNVIGTPKRFSNGMIKNEPWDISTELVIKARNIRGSASPVIRKVHVGNNPNAYYLQGDTSFYYRSPSDNSFRGPNTGSSNEYEGYNCYSFAVGDYTKQAQVRNLVEFNDFIAKKNNFSTRYGDKYKKTSSYIPYVTKVIGYGTLYPTHLAKVYTYDANGYPDKIISKMGSGELIISDYKNGTCYPTYGNATSYYSLDNKKIL